MPYTVASPSPVPTPSPLVVKNGSKSRGLVSSFMPMPVSLTASITKEIRTNGIGWLSRDFTVWGDQNRRS